MTEPSKSTSQKTTSCIWPHQERLVIDNEIYQQAKQRFSARKTLNTASYFLGMRIVVLLERLPVIAKLVEAVRNRIAPIHRKEPADDEKILVDKVNSMAS